MLNKIRPLFDYILVEKTLEKEKTTSTGLIIAKTSKSDSVLSGKITAIGDGRLLQDGTYDLPKVKVGDIAYFLKHEVTLINDNTYVLRETSILGVEEE
ncbi:MAG: co-chaperone GroES family protein [Candidatus Pacebacteria bacterium]|nr:co-chaperone GroES family protein [Candidatus Paceibacterota bacterium]